jgi:NADPH-dependent curcumin reductase
LSRVEFTLSEVEPEDPQPGQMLLRTLWLSLDPYMRGRMNDRESYAPAVGIGDVMVGGTVTEVVASKLQGFTPGDILEGRTGWQEYALSDGSGMRKGKTGKHNPFTRIQQMSGTLSLSLPKVLGRSLA